MKFVSANSTDTETWLRFDLTAVENMRMLGIRNKKKSLALSATLATILPEELGLGESLVERTSHQYLGFEFGVKIVPPLPTGREASIGKSLMTKMGGALHKLQTI